MKKTNTLALVGMILSIVSITFCCQIDMLSYGTSMPLGMLVSLAGGICSFLGYQASRKENFKQPLAKLAITGMIIGGVSLALRTLFLVIVLFCIIFGITLFSHC